MATFAEQDALGAPEQGGLLFVGSSSVRRWEDFARLYSDYGPVQRGFGGGQLSEVARFSDTLVAPHDPRAIVVFAGANDVSIFGVEPAVVVDRFRCLRQRVARDLDARRPIFFVGILPTPDRWEGWAEATEINDAIRELAASDPGVHYVDMPAAFLATGQPPDASLFVEDQLHLNADGYALWNQVLRAAVEAVLDPLPPIETPGSAALPAGTHILVDLGPSEPGRGEPSPSPDAFGRHWNNWHPLEGGSAAHAGQRLERLRDTSGLQTRVGLVLSGGFLADGGAEAGGLASPVEAQLGALAVGSATHDYFYTNGPDQPGALFLHSLDPSARYTIRLFASREASERRSTRYAVQGGTPRTSAVLQTSGDGAGSTGAPGNDDDVVEFQGVQPDAWGRLFIDVAIEEGTEAYLSALHVIVEDGP